MNRDEEILRLKARVFDLSTEMDELKKEIRELENNKELDVQNTIQESVAEVESAPVIEEEAVQNVAVEEATPVEEVSQEAAVINPTVSELPQVEETTTEVQEVVTEPAAVVTPLIQPVEEDVPGPQVLNQTPLTPVGVDIPNVQEEPIATSNEAVDKKVFVKTDTIEPKAILLSSEQVGKSKASEEVQEKMTLENSSVSEVSNPVIEIPTGEVNPVAIAPTVPQTTVTPVANTEGESLETIDARMKELVDMLTTTTDENKANEINADLAALNEKKMLLTKTAA